MTRKCIEESYSEKSARLKAQVVLSRKKYKKSPLGVLAYRREYLKKYNVTPEQYDFLF